MAAKCKCAMINVQDFQILLDSFKEWFHCGGKYGKITQ